MTYETCFPSSKEIGYKPRNPQVGPTKVCLKMRLHSKYKPPIVETLGSLTGHLKKVIIWKDSIIPSVT